MGLWSLDVSNPAQPVKLGQVAVPDTVYDIAATGNHLFSAGTNGVWSVDISRPSAPVVLTNIYPGHAVLSVALAGTSLFAGGIPHTLDAFNVAEPGAPVLASQHILGGIAGVMRVACVGDYVATGGMEQSLRLIPRAEPLVLVETAVAEGLPEGFPVFALNDTHVFAADSRGMLRVFAIHAPATLHSLAKASLGESRSRTLLAATEDTVHLGEKTNLLTLAHLNGEDEVASI
jgi:hypothetical protein